MSPCSSASCSALRSLRLECVGEEVRRVLIAVVDARLAFRVDFHAAFQLRREPRILGRVCAQRPYRNGARSFRRWWSCSARSRRTQGRSTGRGRAGRRAGCWRRSWPAVRLPILPWLVSDRSAVDSSFESLLDGRDRPFGLRDDPDRKHAVQKGDGERAGGLGVAALHERLPHRPAPRAARPRRSATARRTCSRRGCGSPRISASAHQTPGCRSR